MNCVVQTPPTSQDLEAFVPMEEIRLQLGMGLFTSDLGFDLRLAQCRAAAIRRAEEITSRTFLPTTWNGYLSSFPRCSVLDIPKGWTGTDSFQIQYTPDGGAAQTLPPETYILDNIKDPARVVLSTGHGWPSVTLPPVNGVKVTFKAGRPPASIPADVKHAVLLLIGHYYQFAEDGRVGGSSIVEVKTIPHGVMPLLRSHMLLGSEN